MEALDRQALYVVQAIRDVAAELERRRAIIRTLGDEASVERTRAIDDIDRLTNLVSLANSLSRDDLQSATRQALDDTLQELRRRISRLGTALTIGRIRELRDEAEGSTIRHEHPLGKAVILRDRFVRYLGHLIGLAEGLTPEHEADLRSAAAAVNVLIAADRQKWGLTAFDHQPHLPPIDMDSVTFQSLDDDPAEIERAA